MTDLLTLNGIPPMQVGSITIDERAAIMNAFQDRDFALWLLSQTPDPSIEPFGRIVQRAVNAFTGWGATPVEKNCSIKIWANDLPAGSTTFAYSQDENWHGDDGGAPRAFRQDNKLVLRILWASTQHPKYIDLTNNPQMMSILDKHRNYATGGRIFHPTIEQAAIQHGGRIIVPDAPAVMVFDGITGHKPFLLGQAERRILMSAWYEFEIPANGLERVAAGDVPRLPEPTCP